MRLCLKLFEMTWLLLLNSMFTASPQTQQFKTPERKKVGRPSKGSVRPQNLHHIRENVKQVKNEQLEALHRQTMGMGSATRHSGSAHSKESIMKDSPKHTLPIPKRVNSILSDEQIRMVLYILRLVL
jgi:hypothetical protein